MIKVCKFEQECSGCTACYSICPQKAIEMKQNEKGFLTPYIDENKCINCGLCKKVCDFNKKNTISKKPQAYAVKNKSNNEVITSRSGAFFMAVSKAILLKNGVIYGCCIDNELKVYHKRATTYEECKSFKGSKYVQSDLKNCFIDCLSDLKQDKYVLFSGTGCQIHGLISFLESKGVNHNKLYTIDLVCHGVPSPEIFEKYLKILESKKDRKIIKFDFRDKEKFGWRDHIEKVYFDDKSTINMKNWTNMFYRHLMFRESCYNCKYATIYRKSDFTIADYWGIEKNAPEFDDNKGVSLVLVNSNHAEQLFEEVRDFIYYKKTEIENSMQNQLYKSINKGIGYTRFWKEYLNNKDKTIRKYFFPNVITRYIIIINKKIKKILKVIISLIKR